MANNKLYIECISCSLLTDIVATNKLVSIAKYYPVSGWESIASIERALDNFFNKHNSCAGNNMQGNTNFRLVFEHHDNKELERR